MILSLQLPCPRTEWRFLCHVGTAGTQLRSWITTKTPQLQWLNQWVHMHDRCTGNLAKVSLSDHSRDRKDISIRKPDVYFLCCLRVCRRQLGKKWTLSHCRHNCVITTQQRPTLLLDYKKAVVEWQNMPGQIRAPQRVSNSWLLWLQQWLRSCKTSLVL